MYALLTYLDFSLGPIVRITPDEVHSNDCDFIDEIFPGEVKRKRNKPLHQVRSYLYALFTLPLYNVLSSP